MKNSEMPTYVALDGPIIDINCGDGRRPVDDDAQLYAKIFGGRPALAWHALALAELHDPGSVQQSLTEADAVFADQGLYEKASIQGGVHSDEHCEGEGSLIISPESETRDVGCGRWQKGAAIAAAAFEHINDIGHEIQKDAPNLVREPDAMQEMHDIAAANARLAQRILPNNVAILPSGREVVLSSLQHGADGLVLRGEHEEGAAWYNLAPTKTNDNISSQRYFGADGWVVSQFFAANKERFGIDERLALLQDVIIAKATRLVLANTSRVDGIIS